MRSAAAARLALCLLLPLFAWTPCPAAANRPPPGAAPAVATPAELCRAAVAQAWLRNQAAVGVAPEVNRELIAALLAARTREGVGAPSEP
jgi:hypothetical protein